MTLSAAEQYAIELINRARLDPAAEALRYGVALNAGLSAGTISNDALYVLAPNTELEKIRIVLDGLRGEDNIAEPCRRVGISQSIYYKWSKDFMDQERYFVSESIVYRVLKATRRSRHRQRPA